MTGPPESPPPARDYSGLIILGVLGAAEVGIIYLLIVLDTPIAPITRRLAENPIGIVLLALFAAALLCVGMWGFTAWAERLYRKQQRQQHRSEGGGAAP